MKKESKYKLKVLLADGAPSQNDLLMQFQSDILGYPVFRNKSQYVSAIGAAFLSGLNIGLWNSEEDLGNLNRNLDEFNPEFSENKRKILYKGWKKAVKRVISI